MCEREERRVVTRLFFPSPSHDRGQREVATLSRGAMNRRASLTPLFRSDMESTVSFPLITSESSCIVKQHQLPSVGAERPQSSRAQHQPDESARSIESNGLEDAVKLLQFVGKKPRQCIGSASRPPCGAQGVGTRRLSVSSAKQQQHPPPPTAALSRTSDAVLPIPS